MRKILSLVLLLFLFSEISFASSSRDFNGSSDNLNFTSSSYCTSSLPISSGCWINADTNTADMGVLTCGAGGVSGWNLAANQFGSNDWGMGKNQVADISSGGTVSTATWTFIGFIATGSGITFYKLTKAGTLTKTTSANTSAIDNTPAPSLARVGCGLNSGSANAGFFDGRISNCFSKDVAMTEGEFLDFAQKTLVGSPHGYWPIWGDSTENDLSGNGFNATVTGTTASADGPPVTNGGSLPL